MAGAALELGGRMGGDPVRKQWMRLSWADEKTEKPEQMAKLPTQTKGYILLPEK